MFSWLMMLLAIGVQQSDSVICIHVSVLFQILFPFGFLQSSLCYIVGPYRLSNLYIAMCTCQPKLSVYPSPLPFPLVTIKSFSKSMKSVLPMSSFVSFVHMHPPISNIILFAFLCLTFFHLVRSSPGLSMLAASGNTSFCLVLSDAVSIYQCLPPSNSLSSFSYDIQASGGQLQLKALVPAPSFPQLPLPTFPACTGAPQLQESVSAATCFPMWSCWLFF